MEDGLDNVGVEGKLEATPVGANAKAAELVFGDVGVLLDIVPDHGIEGVAIEAEAGLFVFGEFFLEDKLGFDAGVVGAGLVEGVAALHAVVADEDILEGGEHGVADMEGVVGIGRRHNKAEGLSSGGNILVWIKGARSLPAGVDFFFDCLMVILLVHEKNIISWGRGGCMKTTIKRDMIEASAPLIPQKTYVFTVSVGLITSASAMVISPRTA